MRTQAKMDEYSKMLLFRPLEIHPANTYRYRNVFYRFQIGYVEPDVWKTFSQRLRSVSTYFDV